MYKVDHLINETGINLPLIFPLLKVIKPQRPVTKKPEHITALAFLINTRLNFLLVSH